MEPLLVHVHVPKCAGTSFRRYLDASFGSGHVSLYVNRASFLYTSEVIARTVLIDDRVNAISSHFIRVFPPTIGNRVALYVTFLREPVRHFLSYLTYFKKKFSQLVDPEVVRGLPQEFMEMSLREITEWILTRDTVVPWGDNYQTNFFAEEVWSGVSGYHRAPSEYLMSRWDPQQFSRYRAVRLDLARCVLENFFFTGLVEDIQRGVRALRDKCTAMGWTLSDQPLGRENSSQELLDELRWLHPGDRVGKLLLDSLQEDFELYRWAVAAYEKSTRRGGTCPSIAWDRHFVTPAVSGGTKDSINAPVYHIANGMKRLVRNSAELPQIPGTSPEVLPVEEWELATIPPGEPL